MPAEVAVALRLLPGLKRGRSAAREPEPVLPVPWSQVAPALPFLRRQVRGIVEVLWWTGARVTEICAMRHGDLDRGGAVWIYRVRDEANKLAHAGHARTIALGPRAQAVIRPFVDRAPAPHSEAFVFSSAEAMAEMEAERRAARTLPAWPSHDPELRRKRRGAPPREFVRYTRTSLRRAIERACEQAGVEPWAPGRLRHSCATRLRGELGDLQTVAAVLGHKDPSTTLIYAEADLRRAISMRRRGSGEEFSGSPGKQRASIAGPSALLA